MTVLTRLDDFQELQFPLEKFPCMKYYSESHDGISKNTHFSLDGLLISHSKQFGINSHLNEKHHYSSFVLGPWEA